MPQKVVIGLAVMGLFLAAGPARAADLSDDWVYYGASGRAHIVQHGSHVHLELTWTPNSDPPPHYQVDTTLAGAALDGTWKCTAHHCGSPGGKFHAEVQPGGNQIRVSRTDDPGGANEWNNVVLSRAPASAAAMSRALTESGVVAVYDILFDTDRADIKPASQTILGQIAALLKQDPALRLEVSGHTDNAGTPAHNRTLSTARAQAVVSALAKLGIAAGRLTAQGYGQDRPVAPNDSDMHRALNRRVELRRTGA